MEIFVALEKEDDNDQKFLTALGYGMQKCWHTNWYVQFELTQCGETWSPIPVSKALDDDDDQNVACIINSAHL